MEKNIVFIHGLFMNSHSWQGWVDRYTAHGFTCHAPDWPHHAGLPATLRDKPDPALAHLQLKDVQAFFENFIAGLDSPPILVGHSMGGLLVQLLLQKGVAQGGVAINSAPPRGLSSFKWSFLKSNLPIVNPLRGNSIYLMPQAHFHYTFCNTMSRAESDKAWEKFLVPESRNVPRSSTQRQAIVDFQKPHAPLLFIAGGSDHIIPPGLNHRNAARYADKKSVTDIKEFKGRGHFICGQAGWEEVADFCELWIRQNILAHQPR